MPTTITGTLVDAATNLITAGTFVRFLLKGTQGIQPVVTGVGALVAGSGTGQGYFVDFIPSASGVISGSVYSTRDATGLLAGEIKINGNGTACWWEVSIWRGNKKVSSVHTHAKTGVTLDVGNLTALSTTPVATAPSGDSVYARLDGSNQPFTGNVSMNGTLAVTGASTVSGQSKVADGSAAAPGLAFTSDTGTGFQHTSAGQFAVNVSGAHKLLWDNTQRMASNFPLSWSSNTEPLGNPPDTGLSRDAAGVVDVGNGTQGDKSGNVKLATLTLGKPDGTLPATVANDATGGVTITSNNGNALQWGNTSGLIVNPSALNTGAALTVGGTSATTGGMSIFVGALGSQSEMAAVKPSDGATAALRVQALSVRALSGGVLIGTQSFGVTNAGVVTGGTFTGATSGNNVSVLSAQGATTAITGTAADAVVYTYSLPANVVDTTSKGIRITCAGTHNSGTANPAVKININGVNVVTGNIGTSASQSVTFQATILRTASTTGESAGIATVTGVLNPFSVTLAGLAWTSGQTITFTFNVAATDQFTGRMFLVEQIQ